MSSKHIEAHGIQLRVNIRILRRAQRDASGSEVFLQPFDFPGAGNRKATYDTFSSSQTGKIVSCHLAIME